MGNLPVLFKVMPYSISYSSLSQLLKLSWFVVGQPWHVLDHDGVIDQTPVSFLG